MSFSDNDIILNFDKADIPANLFSQGQFNTMLKPITRTGIFNSQDYRVAITNLNVFNSFPTFSQQATLSYLWPASAVTGLPITSYTVTISSNSNHTIPSLESLIKATMKVNRHYLLNASGNEVYYFSLQPNSINYSSQLVELIIPTSLPGGFTNPGLFPFPTLANQVVQTTFIDQNLLSFLGFNAGQYPSSQAGVDYAINSQLAPTVNRYSSVNVHLNLAYNVDNTFDKLVLSKEIVVSYGSPIVFESVNDRFYKLLPQNNNLLELTLRDSKGNLLPVLDFNWTCTVLFRKVR